MSEQPSARIKFVYDHKWHCWGALREVCNDIARHQIVFEVDGVSYIALMPACQGTACRMPNHGFAISTLVNTGFPLNEFAELVVDVSGRELCLERYIYLPSIYLDDSQMDEAKRSFVVAHKGAYGRRYIDMVATAAALPQAPQCIVCGVRPTLLSKWFTWTQIRNVHTNDSQRIPVCDSCEVPEAVRSMFTFGIECAVCGRFAPSIDRSVNFSGGGAHRRIGGRVCSDECLKRYGARKKHFAAVRYKRNAATKQINHLLSLEHSL